MSLTASDLRAIGQVFDERFEKRVPKILDERVPALIDARVQPMLDKLEERLGAQINTLDHKVDELTLDVGQFSLETTNNFIDVNERLDRLEARSRPIAH